MMPGNGNQNQGIFALHIEKVPLDPAAYRPKWSYHAAIALHVVRIRLESIQAQPCYTLSPSRVELF